MPVVLLFVTAGMVQGVAAGLTPGPLLALVLAEAVRRGARSAMLVALAPLITDAPILAIAILATRALPALVLALLAGVGGVYLGWIGVSTLREALADLHPIPSGQTPLSESTTRWRAVRTGVIGNALNPHPYLFWTLIGAPSIAAARASGGIPAAAALLIGLYSGLVVTTMALGIAAAHGGRLMGTRGYRVLLGGCGVALIALALALLREVPALGASG